MACCGPVGAEGPTFLGLYPRLVEGVSLQRFRESGSPEGVAQPLSLQTQVRSGE
jgi:hypothetical protein